MIRVERSLGLPKRASTSPGEGRRAAGTPAVGGGCSWDISTESVTGWTDNGCKTSSWAGGK
ncbi:hypothetical protein GCM10009757_39030 [Streptomyces cheonanensis]|uniref:Uncharacterized protein n=1 Tax=Streptomyces cheonanensis TaxID=312720 RepID=A0ABP5GZ52_9ACTN